LNEIELVPFKKAIDAGLLGIMSSHINFPALTEEGRPTTLSKSVLTNLLREQLGFEGLIVSDCMQMKGIQNHYTTPEACVMAIEAGINIVCVSHSKEIQTKSYHRLVEAAFEKRLDKALIDERVDRILKFKKELIKLKSNQDYQLVKHMIENDKTKKFAYEVVEKGATLIKGSLLKLHHRALLIAILPVATTIADEKDAPFDFLKAIQDELPNLTVLKSPIDPDDEAIDEIIKSANAFDQIIMTSYNSNIYQNQMKLIEHLHHINKEVHIISTRNPYDLHMTDCIENYVCLYESTPNAMKVLLKYLKGDLKPEGKVPIHVK
jgi:beta-N-acetylhexosaminidase